MDIEVNYRNKRRYKTARYPLHQTIFWTWLIWFLSKIMLIGKEFKVEKINMEGLKPPYMILSNHKVSMFCHEFRKMVITGGIFSNAMHDLQDSTGLALRLPSANMNAGLGIKILIFIHSDHSITS